MLDGSGEVGEVLGEQAGQREAAHPHRVDREEQEPAIAVEQALWCFTAGGARLNGSANQLGQLAPGFLADMAVLSGDPLDAPPERLLEIEVAQTWVGGTLAFDR